MLYFKHFHLLSLLRQSDKDYRCTLFYGRSLVQYRFLQRLAGGEGFAPPTSSLTDLRSDWTELTANKNSNFTDWKRAFTIGYRSVFQRGEYYTTEYSKGLNHIKVGEHPALRFLNMVSVDHFYTHSSKIGVITSNV